MPGTGYPGVGAGFPGVYVQNRVDLVLQGPDVQPDDSRSRLGRKLMISGAKFEGFRGWKVGKLGEMLDPLETKKIHGSKSKKYHQTNKSQKTLGANFGGDFRI